MINDTATLPKDSQPEDSSVDLLTREAFQLEISQLNSQVTELQAIIRDILAEQTSIDVKKSSDDKTESTWGSKMGGYAKTGLKWGLGSAAAISMLGATAYVCAHMGTTEGMTAGTKLRLGTDALWGDGKAAGTDALKAASGHIELSTEFDRRSVLIDVQFFRCDCLIVVARSQVHCAMYGFWHDSEVWIVRTVVLDCT